MPQDRVQTIQIPPVRHGFWQGVGRFVLIFCLALTLNMLASPPVEANPKYASIIIEESSSREARHVSSRVLWIEWDDQSDLDKQLCSAFTNGRDQEVLAGLSEVLNQRPPVWRQQWLTMLGTVSAWRTHRGRISLELVSQLDKRPLPLMTVAWLPISWTNRVEPDIVVRDIELRCI